jgi:hypothetical protein
VFHATFAELTAVFGVANQGFDARPAVHKTDVGLRVVSRETTGIESKLLKAAFLEPFQPDFDTG